MDKYSALKSLWGYDDFRPGQEELMDAILAGGDALGIMPTGAGKSICFQVPAMLLQGITLVISPLISLMKDQVQALITNGIPAAYINSSLSMGQTRKAIKNAATGMYKIIYVAPERLEVPEFVDFALAADISMVAVDEAHCVSQWGQDFRPSYLKINDFVRQLQRRPVLSAFTATATPEVREDIVEMLGLNSPFIKTTGFDRPNLYFEVQKPRNKYQALAHYLERNPNRSGIVYCATRKTVEQVCASLQRDGYLATRYHAGLPERERSANQDDFLYDRADIMVATNAFGMGIDKSNVGFIIHYNMPKNIESYYQEAGRAGRDGEPAQCTILYSGQDVFTNRFLIENGSDFREDLSEETRREIKEKEYEKLKDITFYCTGTSCLREYILTYFGEDPPNYCGNCTNCQTNFERVDITVEAQKIVSCVIRMANQKGYFGKGMLVDVLNGKSTERIRRLGFDTLTTYRIMADTPKKNIRAMIDFLIREGYLSLSGGEYPVIGLAARWNQIIKGRTVIEMRLPKEQQKAQSRKTSVDSDVDEALFHKLKSLRSRLAAAAGVPAYIVFTDASLRGMCGKLPKNNEEFLSVPGVGHAKLEKYGVEFIAAIQEYVNSGGAILRSDEPSASDSQSQSYRDQVIKKGANQANQPWTAEEDEELRHRYRKWVSVPALAEIHKRTREDILARLKKLGLVEEPGFSQKEETKRNGVSASGHSLSQSDGAGKKQRDRKNEAKAKGKRVEVSSKVSYLNTQTNRRETFRILPSYTKHEYQRMGGAYYGNTVSASYLSDSDPDKGTIGAESPLAKALLGHYAGDTVEFKTPGGEVMNLKVISVKHENNK